MTWERVNVGTSSIKFGKQHLIQNGLLANNNILQGVVALAVGLVPRRIVPELRHFHLLLKMNNQSNWRWQISATPSPFVLLPRRRQVLRVGCRNGRRRTGCCPAGVRWRTAKTSRLWTRRWPTTSMSHGYVTGVTWARHNRHMGVSQSSHGYVTFVTWARHNRHMGTSQSSHGHVTIVTWVRQSSHWHVTVVTWVRRRRHMGTSQSLHGYVAVITWARHNRHMGTSVVTWVRHSCHMGTSVVTWVRHSCHMGTSQSSHGHVTVVTRHSRYTSQSSHVNGIMFMSWQLLKVYCAAKHLCCFYGQEWVTKWQCYFVILFITILMGCSFIFCFSK